MSLRLLNRAVQPIRTDAAREVLLRLHEPCLLLGPDRRVLFANDLFRERLLGADEEPENRLLFSLAGGAFDTAEMRGLLDGVTSGGSAHEQYVHVTLPHAGPRTLQAAIVPLGGSRLRAELTVLVANDHTDLVRVTEERTRLARAVEQAGDAVVIIDPSGHVEFANPAVERITGIAPTDAVSRPATAVFQLPARSLRRIVSGVRRTGYWSGVVSGRRPDMGTYELDVLVSEVCDPERQTVGYVAVGRDLSRERVLERRIEMERADRAQVAFALARVHPVAAADEAAAALCREFYNLPWIDAVAIISFTPGGSAVPIAVEGPLAIPLRRDVPLPVSVGVRLRERMATGSWVDDLAIERLANDDHREVDAWWRLGITTLINVPLQCTDGRCSGLLIVGTRLPAGTEELAQAIPTIVELGAFATAMVGAKLEHQNERILAQRRIWDIVAGSAFTAVFQPIVDLDSGRVAGYEALTRFHDGTSPEERFAEARAVGLDLILERACLQAALAESAGLPPEAWVSLNVTPEYLIRRSGRNPLGRRDRPSRIVLEIAEQSAIEDYGRLRESLSSLRQEGVAIAVDDAGVGFDTLRRLLELRPEFIKLDRSLIRGLARDGVRQALVSAIVQFAQQAGASLIAEGVERPEERDALHRLGVRYGQGFLLGAPVPAGLDAGRGRHRVRHGRTPPDARSSVGRDGARAG